ncbi:hypothetical protein [Fervidibacillus albus]|uniref:Uncharacterized protein n=1 Tax=Fervidibacillus albus TaxID=2980026 RepID=A0A9E8LUG2_9BACI|nr:hypothetical protein [Fervidibacillus albus]WAA09863.1 hypothetical protein OE104_00320 [Fervidibacillus albus]
MNEDENKRRTIIYAFFMGTLDKGVYFDKYQTDVLEDYPEEFEALLDNELIEIVDKTIKLNRKGRRYTDLIGSVFWSPKVDSMFEPI